MAFLKRSDLSHARFSESKVLNYHRKSAATGTSVFLSHSHKDTDIINQAIQTLGDYGVQTYIDWKDHTMPEITNANTAFRLKQKIVELDKFVLLASNRALASRWVPWELGVADSANGLNNVLIMPVEEDNGPGWNGNEYIRIYPRIERDQTSGKLYVIYTDGNKSKWLKDWLTE